MQDSFFMGLHFWHGPNFLIILVNQDYIFFFHIVKITRFPIIRVKSILNLKRRSDVERVSLEESGRL